MGTPASDLRQLIVNSGVIENSNAFYGREPDSSSLSGLVLTVYDTGGQKPEHLLDGVNLEAINVQIRIRGVKTQYENTYQKALAVSIALDRTCETTINGTLYDSIYQATPVTFLKYDDKDRPIFVVNFQISLRRQ